MTEPGLGDFYPEAMRGVFQPDGAAALQDSNASPSEPSLVHFTSMPIVEPVATPETETSGPSWLQTIEGAAAEKPKIARREIDAYNEFLADMKRNASELAGKGFPNLSLAEVATLIREQIQSLLEKHGLQMRAETFDRGAHKKVSFYNNDTINIPLKAQNGPFYPLIVISVEQGWLPKAAHDVRGRISSADLLPITQRPPYKGKIIVGFIDTVGQKRHSDLMANYS